MKKIAVIMTVLMLCTASVSAAEIVVASGAGFKKFVTDMAVVCEKKYGVKMNMSFGNLGQVIAQIKTTGLVEAVIGDRRFLAKAGPEFAETALMGRGKLVLAWRKGISINTPEDITGDSIKRIAIPNFQKAIYGRAGLEYLESTGMKDSVAERLLEVATVPQVTSYVVTGEVDAGFSNLTDIMGVSDKIGGYIVIEEGYSRIDIITGIIRGAENSESAGLYRKCAASADVRAVAAEHGL